MSHKTRRRWSLVLLLIWMPLYLVVCVTIMSVLDRPPIWLELAIYATLGVLWCLPFRRVFLGVGKAPPEGQE